MADEKDEKKTPEGDKDEMKKLLEKSLQASPALLKDREQLLARIAALEKAVPPEDDTTTDPVSTDKKSPEDKQVDTNASPESASKPGKDWSAEKGPTLKAELDKFKADLVASLKSDIQATVKAMTPAYMGPVDPESGSPATDLVSFVRKAVDQDRKFRKQFGTVIAGGHLHTARYLHKAFNGGN